MPSIVRVTCPLKHGEENNILVVRKRLERPWRRRGDPHTPKTNGNTSGKHLRVKSDFRIFGTTGEKLVGITAPKIECM
jgi:hypothetical protein